MGGPFQIPAKENHMKHLKMLSLFAMAAAALLAFAGSASAQTLTSPTGTEYTGLVTESFEGSMLLKAGFAEITCTGGTLNSTITTNNSTEASGVITKISFSGCKEGQTFDTLNNNGTLTILKSTHAVSGTGTEWTTAVAGVSCVYGFGSTATSLGTATNTVVAGVDIVTTDTSAKLPKISGGFLCASPASMTGNWVITSPATSFLD
jgi:hypothetical protein